MDNTWKGFDLVSRVRENRGNRGNTYYYVVIAIFVFIFNAIAIWGPKFLIEDDGLTYYFALGHMFPYALINHGSALAAFTEWGAWNMMAAFSPQLVRLIYILIYMIPVSWLFFKLLQRYLGSPAEPAIAAAILPTALPSQWAIPAFLNGSYVVPNLLLFLATLITGFVYLEAQPGHRNRWLFASLLLYLGATQLGDNAIFLYPAMILLIIFYRRINRQTVILVAGYSFFFLVKTLWIFFFPRPAAEIFTLNQAKIINRMRFYFLSMLPIPHGGLEQYSLLMAFIVMAIILTGFLILYLQNSQKFLESGKENNVHVYGPPNFKTPVLIIYGFFLLWTTASIAAFIFVSRWQSGRYAFIAAYGFNAILLISLYAILKQLSRKRKKIILILFFGLVVFSGTARFFELKKIYGLFNSQQSMIQKNLQGIQEVKNAQVMIYVPNGWNNFWPLYQLSSGHLKYILNKKDVTGLFTYNDTYYTLGSPKQHSSSISKGMDALDWKRPLFFYACSYGTWKQFEYVVKWNFVRTKLHWKIYKMEKSMGTKTFLAKGKGLDAYKEVVTDLRKRNLITGIILWGDSLEIP